MAQSRAYEAMLAAGKRHRERENELHQAIAHSASDGAPNERRSSKLKAPWPLDTLFSHSSARVFGANSGLHDEGRHFRSLASEATDAGSFAITRNLGVPAQYSLEGASTSRREQPAASSSAAAAVTHPPQQKSSPTLSDLPVTPPDSGMPEFRLPAVADPDRLSYSRGKADSTETGAFGDYLRQRLEPKATTIEPSSKPPSKNDIFNSRSVWISPAPRPPPSPAKAAVSNDDSTASSSSSYMVMTPQRTAPASKNSLFFSANSATATPPPASFNSPRPASSQGSNPQPTPHTVPEKAATASHQSIGRSSGHSRKASLGRANTEEREREQARIRQSKDVDFRLCPSREFLLGEGRHCNVFLGSYRHKRKQARAEAEAGSYSPGRFNGSLVNSLDSRSPEWKLCAIKRLHADRHSQLLGLDEAFALRRLGPHPHIIRLIDIRDEVEFTPSPQPSPGVPPQGMIAELGKGLPTSRPGEMNEVGSSCPQPSGAVAQHIHGRSTSDITGKAEVLSESKTVKRALAAQKEEEVASDRGIEVGRTGRAAGVRQSSSLHAPGKMGRRSKTPMFKIALPKDEKSGIDETASGTTTVLAGSSGALAPPAPSPNSSATDTPRLLILLELLPVSLANFTRLHPDRVDFEQWRSWAKEMAGAVEWLHDRGCIHADLKKENMLLTDDLAIKLCDFNSAVFPNPNDPPTDGMGLGTPAYGAPELSRATGGPGASSFSWPIDIYSLGAVLYSLATGVEPFSNARSVVEILQRKKAFFESEENARADRLAVEGGSNPASSAASRSNSMRGRRRDTSDDAPCFSPGSVSRSLASLLLPASPIMGSGDRRNASTDSLESVASSITTMSGRSPSSYAIARLLDPSPEPKGLLTIENEAIRKGLLPPVLSQQSGVERRASMGRLQQQNHATSLRLRTAQLGEDADRVGTRSAIPPASSQGRLNIPLLARPDALRRASSFGDGVQPGSETVGGLSTGSAASEVPESDLPSSPPMRPSGLRATITPSDLHADHATPTLPHPSQVAPWMQDEPRRLLAHVEPRAAARCRSKSHSSQEAEPENGYEEEDLRPYADGQPALILPGGDRLPDEARDLLRSMVQAAPHTRPTAREVRIALQRL
ncbi:hypothetical protein ACQY0O_002174 [Thecaphora frezii]